MVTKDLESIAQQWIDAFNKHEVDTLLSLYDDNARHYSPRVEEERPETEGWLEGKDQLREWWQRNFDELPSLRYKLCDSLKSRDCVVMIYIREVSGQPKKQVFEYLKIKDDLIIESRVLRSWKL